MKKIINPWKLRIVKWLKWNAIWSTGHCFSQSTKKATTNPSPSPHLRPHPMSTPSSKKKQKKQKKGGGVSKDNSLLNKMRNAKFAQSCLQHHNLYKENATIISAHIGGRMSVIRLLVLSLVIGRMWNKSPPVPTPENSYLKPRTLSWKKGLLVFRWKR